MYLAVPDKQYTFDKDRPSTPFEYLELDRLDGGVTSRWAHYLEFVRLAFKPAPISTEAPEASAREMESKRYSIHFDGWKFSEIADFLDRTCLTVVPPLQCADRHRSGADGVFILRRKAGPLSA